MTALPSFGSLSRVLLAPLLSDVRRLKRLANVRQAPGITPAASVLTELATSALRQVTSIRDPEGSGRVRMCSPLGLSKFPRGAPMDPRDFGGSKLEATPYPPQHAGLSLSGSVSCRTFKLSPFAGLSPLSFSPWDLCHPIAGRRSRPVPRVAA